MFAVIFAVDLQWICSGFAVALQWVCSRVRHLKLDFAVSLQGGCRVLQCLCSDFAVVRVPVNGVLQGVPQGGAPAQEVAKATS